MAATTSPPPSSPEPDPPSATPKPIGQRTTSPAVAIPVALIATFFAWVAVDRYYGAVDKPAMSAEYLAEAEEKWAHLGDLSPHLLEEAEFKHQVFLYRNTALVLGLVGGVFGLCFGLLAGMERDRISAAARGAVAGVLAGMAAGVAAGYAGSAVAEYARRHKFVPSSAAEMQRVWMQEMYSSIGSNAAQWCVIGVGLGLVVALCGHPSRSLLRCVGMAVLAGALASAAFTPLAGMLFPEFPADLAIPVGFWNRLIFVALPAVAFTLLLMLQRGKPVAATQVSGS